MKTEDLHIGQKVYSLDPTTPEFKISEFEICGIRSTHDDNIFEVYIESEKFNGTSMHFENGKLHGNHYFFTPDEAKEKYKIRLVEKLNELESQIKELRLKNWELLCK